MVKFSGVFFFYQSSDLLLVDCKMIQCYYYYWLVDICIHLAGQVWNSVFGWQHKKNSPLGGL